MERILKGDLTMIKDIVTDIEVLKIKSKQCFFTELDILNNKAIIKDMIQTADDHKDECLGLAANQIGVHKNIILVRDMTDCIHTPKYTVMVNPKVFCFKTKAKSIEGCLSFPNRDSVVVKRSLKVKVKWQEVTGRTHLKIFHDFDEARVIQHERDHLRGILI